MCKHSTELVRSINTRKLPEKRIPIAEQVDIINSFNNLLSGIKERLDFEYSEVKSFIKEEFFRSEIVMLVSALDYYMFEILKTGITQIYLKERETTESFDNLKLPMKYLTSALENPESNEWLSEAIVEVFGTSSFQSVKQINYVLSIISKKKILGKIASSMSLSRRELTHKINNLCLRRHQIAHNSDIPCESNKEESISFEYIQESIKLISDFINEMHKFIKL